MIDYKRIGYRSAGGDLELFARDYPGDGPPLLLMHGLTRNSADFVPLAQHLAGRYRLIVPDQRGRGLSQNDPDPANYRPDIYARDMFALLDMLGVERAALIGTSMGGLMAMIMAATRPEAVSAVVLNDIGPVLDPAGLARIAGYVGPSEPFADWEEAAANCAAINRDAFPGFAEADWLAFAARTCRQRADGRVEYAYDPAIAAGFADSGDTPQPDLWPLWEALAGKPVLLLRGALSDLLSPETAKEMERRHSGPFTLAEVPRRGHAPLLDEEAAIQAIKPFLKEYAA
ncbi:pimeloyl-ACP methyl ester carboxylesterase [Altererythrobacter atlanticus]|uniref:Haloacetate dehalogenase H-1 n=1 Tax=Croceibacterium atlanticum TaxID=1267766 RepID=A0A0F7KPP4_9SPHN|nr:alpha/beta hydrolase [Croceibacterium atlanticum]AKH42493.1 Haloacetate dehalogenase H-1 [Croceibacterium atlanticum]MBB5731270.1 pimeloyl-ACP methyl ester carboxylesterase [Croceibacterium atlanticum]